MLSYHNNEAVKLKYQKRFAAHRAADQVIQGTGFDNGRGCFVGCTLDDYNHSKFPIELGWPEWLAHLADKVFEGIPASEAPQFGTDLLEAVPIGVDLEPVRHLLAVRRLNRVKATIIGLPEKDVNLNVIACIEGVVSLHEAWAGGNSCSIESWSAAWSEARSAESAAGSAARSAESAAWSAAWSAESAAWSAARSAWSEARSAESAAWSAARSAWSEARSAESAAGSAARSAESAAWSAARSAESAAESAARSAAWSAESAESAAWSAESAESAAWSAESAAWSAAYQQERDDLLDILRTLIKEQ